MIEDLAARKCEPCQEGAPPLSPDRVKELLPRVSGYEVKGNSLVRVYEFQNYYQTMAFVNAVAYVAHREDHHPDLVVSYKKCTVSWTTHKIGGLSENDFIAAAKVNALVG